MSRRILLNVRFCALLVFFCLIVLFKSQVVFAASSESENNNTYSTANSVAIGTDISGSISSQSDVDWYKFTLTSTGYIDISFSHETLDSDIYWAVDLFASDGTTKIYGGNGSWGVDGETNISINNIGLEKGTYYIKVSPSIWWYSSKKYTINISFTQSSVWETENNSTADKADSITVGKSYNGNLCQSDDIDWYSFKLTNAADVTMSFNHAIGSGTKDYWLIDVYKSDKTTKVTEQVPVYINKAATSFSIAGLPAGTYYIQIQANSFRSSKLNYNFMLSSAASTVAEETITISSQPKNVSVDFGNTAKFSVAASSSRGVSLSYKWQISKNNGSTWSDVYDSGYATSALSVVTTLDHSGYKYRCVITGETKTVYSNAATLTVTGSAITITSQPANTSVKSGVTASFSITAKSNLNKSLKYQWQLSKDEGVSWSDTTYSGYNTAQISISALLIYSGYKFRCVVSDGTYSETSNSATLTVTGTYINVTSNPQNVSVYENQLAQFSVKATSAINSTLKYQWQVSKNEGKSWADSSLTGNATNTLSVSATTDKDGYLFRCVIEDEKGNSVTSGTAKLEVIGCSIVINTQPVSSEANVGKTVKYNVKATNTVDSPLSYQWQASKDNGKNWSNSGLTGNKTATLSVAATLARDGYMFRCVICDQQGSKIISDAVSLKVKATPVAILSQSESQTVPKGTIIKFKVNAVSEVNNNLSYQWQVKKPSSNIWNNSGLTGSQTGTVTVQATSARNGYQFRCVVSDGMGNVVTSDPMTLTVGAAETSPISYTFVTGSQSAKIGTNVRFNAFAKSTAGKVKYQWQVKVNNNSEWVDSGMGGSKTATLSVGMTAKRAGYKFRCVITDASGNTRIGPVVTITTRT